MSEELAKHLTRELFEIGNEYRAPTTRIQFMSQDGFREKGQGGMCESAMISFFVKSLEAWDAKQEQSND